MSKHTPFMQEILKTCVVQSEDADYPEITVPYAVIADMENYIAELEEKFGVHKGKDDG